MSQITRSTLRQQVRTAVVERLISGALPPGARINETELARELGVSATPVREALLTLDGTPLLQPSAPGRGFAVAPLDAREMRDIFTVNAALDAMALRLCGPFPGERIARLRAANERFRSLRGDVAQADEADVAFHAELVASCPNQHLLGLIRDGRQAGQRYEYAFLHEVVDTEASAAQHDEIIAALERGSVESAVEALTANWQRTIEVLDACLRR